MYASQRKFLVKTILIIIIGFGLVGCASGAKIGAMSTGVVQINAPLPTKAQGRNAIVVGSVEGGSETYALWKSNVSTENFREALQQSLQSNLYLASGEGRYRLDAMLLDLDQPLLGGFDMTVTAHVRYIVSEPKVNKTVFDEAIKTPYTANFSDALLGVERLRLANEGAIRKNIQELILKLNTNVELSK